MIENKPSGVMRVYCLKFMTIALVAVLLANCQKLERDNPWDEKATFDPSDWAPQNFQVEGVSITEKKISWSYEDRNIEGFKLDRKKGDEPWQVGFQSFSKETRSWNDTDIIPDPELSYSYRLHTYAGINESGKIITSIINDFPAPTNLQMERLSDISYTLSWQDNSTGEEGFKIDRKTPGNDWVIGYAVVGENITAFVDTNVFVGKSTINVEYRVYAFYQGFESVKTNANTNAALSPPSNLSITQNTITSVTLNWQDTLTGEEGFRVERKQGTGNWELLATLKETNYTDEAFELNTDVSYRIAAYYGQYISEFVENSFDSQIPAPTSLQVFQNNLTSVALNWQDNSTGEEGFRIERKQGAGSWELLANLTGTNYTDEAFALNTDVSYRIAAYYGLYHSDYVENSFNSQIPPPENLTVIVNSYNSVTLNWSCDLIGHEGFRIERKMDNGNWEMLAGNLGSDQDSFLDDDVDLMYHNYRFRIFVFYGQNISQKITFPELPDLCGIQIINDTRDGSQYETVKIGEQCWMKENLQWLPSVSSPANGSYTSPFYYVYGYQGISVSEAKATSNYQTYGVLYNWTAALNACPAGWHLPSDSEWTVLANHLGGSNVAGSHMKTTGTTHWISHNTDATNSSGFSGLPAGSRIDGGFSGIRYYATWWSSTEDLEWATSAFYCQLSFIDTRALRDRSSKPGGYPVRCLRD